MEGIWDSIAGWAKEHLSDWTIIKAYIGCAIAGGTMLLGQVGLNLFGFGDDAEVDPDVSVDDLEGGGGLNFLSLRALSGFLSVFGLVGWMGTEFHWGSTLTAFAALASGGSVMVMIAFVMRAFMRLHSEGNLQPKLAIGKTARVYLRIPGNNSGKGKITVSIQGRSAEFEAVTRGAELPSGDTCRIVGMTTEDTFVVTSLDSED